MQLIESSRAILLSPELNNATASRATLFILEDVYSYNIASLSHMILEVFPLSLKRKIGQKQTSTLHVYLVVSKIPLIKNLVADKFAANKFLLVTIRPKIMSIYCLPFLIVLPGLVMIVLLVGILILNGVSLLSRVAVSFFHLLGIAFLRFVVCILVDKLVK